MTLPIARVLCPTDFSISAANAFHYALAVADWFKADLDVVHVCRLSVPVLASGAGSAGNDAATALPPTDVERDQLMAELRRFVAAGEPSGPEVTWHLDESTDVPEAIVRRAAAVRAQLVVLGTHGRSGLRRFVIGSVAERVLRTAACAVLVVPPGAPRVPAAGPRLDRIVCAIDFSDGSRRALECAATVAELAQAALTVAHIVELPPDVPDFPPADLSRYREARFDQARAVMDSAVAPVRQRVARLDTLLLAGRPGPELLCLAADQQAALIVMGVTGRSAADVLMFGSVTHHVIEQASCGVLTVPN